MIESAVAADGVTMPADQLFQMLEEQVWPDPDVDEFPDSYQAGTRAKLLAVIENFGDGELPHGGAYNRLEPGLWEFKQSSVRLTFYATDGLGNFHSTEGTPSHFNGYQLYDDDLDQMDEYLRLGHHFPKTGQTTPQAQIELAKQVRTEDLAHDN